MFGYVPPVGRLQSSPPDASAASLVRYFSRGRRLHSVAAEAPAVGSGERRGLIIDLDDTLYPRERFVRSGLAAVAQHVSVLHGVDASEAYLVMTRALASGRAGAEMQALCDRYGWPHGDIPAFVDVFRSHTPSLYLAAEAVEALRTLRRAGWGLVVLTNGLPSVQFRKVVALDLMSLVDDVIYAEEHAPGGKPSPAPFHAALRSLDLAAADCVCAGDDLVRDIHGARALGMATIRLARPGVAVDPEGEADVVIHSIRQLPDAATLLRGKVVADVA
jgi:putative hydrolase of the HAD superfamily